MTFDIFLVVTIFLALLTVLPILDYPVWWIRGLDFPRLQFFLFSLIFLLVTWIVLDSSRASTWLVLLVIGACVAYQAWWIIPYTPLFPVEVKSELNTNSKPLITIMAANVLTTNRNSDGLIELVRENKPDILVTLETNEWWQTQLEVLETDYPHTIKCPLDNLYGMHVYSRLKLSDSKIEYLVEPDVPSMHTLVTLPNGQKVRAHFLHPAPPSPTENDESSERDAELLAVAKSVVKSKYPIIVTGDLNDVAWSKTTRLFRKISGLLDPRVGRGMYSTYHADYWFIRWPLDHLFHSEHFTFKDMRRLRGFGSDHFPLLATLVCETADAHEQKGLDADNGDKDLAEAKMDHEDIDEDDVPTPGK